MAKLNALQLATLFSGLFLLSACGGDDPADIPNGGTSAASQGASGGTESTAMLSASSSVSTGPTGGGTSTGMASTGMASTGAGGTGNGMLSTTAAGGGASGAASIATTGTSNSSGGSRGLGTTSTTAIGSVTAATASTGIGGNPATTTGDGTGGMPAGGGGTANSDGDTWTTFAQGFFQNYCVMCHDEDGAGDPNRDFTQLAVVIDEANQIACGVATVATRPTLSCGPGAPMAEQFPNAAGGSPTTEERERLVAWIEAGMPE